jgi:hypothetical protein
MSLTLLARCAPDPPEANRQRLQPADLAGLHALDWPGPLDLYPPLGKLAE